MGVGWKIVTSAVTQLTSPDGSLTITNPGGPVVGVESVFGPANALVRPPAIRTTPLTTAVLPGVFPYAGSVSYLSLGSAMDAMQLQGTYRFSTSLFLEVSAANTEYWIDVFINDLPSETFGIGIKAASQTVGKANASALIGAPFMLDFPVLQPAWLDIRVAKGGGTGSVTYSFGSIEVTRVA